ncbi:hypothetical protein ONZ45_g4411 [Pleurotus djamor]|nr:hypothetical protein ONZ45_g4411 [Pleurotus djamor]
MASPINLLVKCNASIYSVLKTMMSMQNERVINCLTRKRQGLREREMEKARREKERERPEARAEREELMKEQKNICLALKTLNATTTATQKLLEANTAIAAQACKTMEEAIKQNQEFLTRLISSLQFPALQANMN